MQLNEKTVNELRAEINRLEAQIYTIKEIKVNKNTPILIEELRNFKDRVGEGFRDGDYYTTSRYYSRIPGVKNIRWGSLFGKNHSIIDVIEVKITSPIGELLPKSITVNDIEYPIVYSYSKHYSEELDY